PRGMGSFPRGMGSFPRGMGSFPRGMGSFPQGDGNFPRGMDLTRRLRVMQQTRAPSDPKEQPDPEPGATPRGTVARGYEAPTGRSKRKFALPLRGAGQRAGPLPRALPWALARDAPSVRYADHVWNDGSFPRGMNLTRRL